MKCIDAATVHTFLAKETGVCQRALDWVRDRPPRQAWEECEEGYWLVGLIVMLVGRTDNFTLREEIAILTHSSQRNVNKISPHRIRSMVSYDYLEEQLRRRLTHDLVEEGD